MGITANNRWISDVKRFLNKPSALIVQLVAIALLALVYFLSGQLIFEMSEGVLNNRVVSIVIFIPEGIALAAVLIFGRRIWPGIFIGQYMLASSMGMPLLPSLGIAATNSLEALLAVYLFDRFKLDRALSTWRDIGGLLILIAAVLQPFSAILGNSVLLAFSTLTYQGYLMSLFSWWFGNLLGQFLLTPMLLLIYAGRDRIKFLDTFLVVVFFLALYLIVVMTDSVHSLPIMLTLTLPLVTLLAIYKDLIYATMATTLLALMAIYSTHNGMGPFSSGDPVANIIDLNFYILAHIFLVLIVGGVFRERNKIERQLKEKNSELKRSIIMREQVERMVQHDLKTPLNALVSVPGYLTDTEAGLSVQGKELLMLCKDSAYTMLDMINKSLDVYRIENGVYQLTPVKLDILAILKQVLAHNGISFQAGAYYPLKLNDQDIADTDHCWACGEEILCYSLFSNLVRNALEASSDGSPIGIQIALDERASQCVVTVANKGSISPAIRARFFDKLMTSEKPQGTGLGTYSARLYAEVQGGEISLDCSENDRVKVIVRLPSFGNNTATSTHHVTTERLSKRKHPIDKAPFNLPSGHR